MPSTVPKPPPSIVPYIFTRDEMRRLLDATPRYRRPPLHIEPHTFRALLLLLYGAGLRIGEARRLRLGDVDLAAALLTIDATKFYKTRLVPLGADLTRAMQHYAEHRQTRRAPRHDAAAFFVDRHGAPLRGSTVRQAFAQLRRCAGVVRVDGARYQPRLHDVRHTFVVDRLTTWYRHGRRRADAATPAVNLPGACERGRHAGVSHDDSRAVAGSLCPLCTLCRHGGGRCVIPPDWARGSAASCWSTW